MLGGEPGCLGNDEVVAMAEGLAERSERSLGRHVAERFKGGQVGVEAAAGGHKGASSGEWRGR